MCNNETIQMDTAAEIFNSRTYVPIRFIAEAFGYEVTYEQGGIMGYTSNENGELMLITSD